MCGIAGFLTTRPTENAAALVESMLDVIAHRGPDGRGVATRRGEHASAAVGAVRLSLLDLPRGHQPMVSGDGSVVLVFNGEITNHDDLRRRHLRDYPFSSRSDTETLLALWQRLGPECIVDLEGMFAFAVASGGELWLGRDRAGIKPLFVHGGDNATVSFASETKAFLPLPWFDPRLDPRALVEHAVMGHPLDGRTWWEDAVEVEAGTVLHVTGQPDGRLDRRSWAFAPPGAPDDDFDESPANLERLLEGCVDRHLVSDHPRGVFLSGGLDSTVIAGLAARVGARRGSAEPLHTFTFGDGPGLEDVVAARLVAQTLGTEHHQTVVRFDDVAANLAASVWDAERPGSDLGASLAIAAARSHVKSVLVGEGSDELFGGYWLHRDPLSYVRRQIAAYVRCYRWHGRAVDHRVFEPMRRWLVWMSRGPDDERRRRVRAFFLGSPLRAMHLHPWDLNSMAGSLEVRVPYLSKEIYEHAEILMTRRQPADWGDKPHLREVARRVLPTGLAQLVTERPKRAAPTNFSRFQERLAAHAERLVPADHLAGHPLRHCVGPAAGSQALGVLLFDLFIMAFVVRRCRPSDEVDPAALYTRPDELGALRDALAEIDLPMNDRPVEGNATDVARAALAPSRPAAGSTGRSTDPGGP